MGNVTLNLKAFWVVWFYYKDNQKLHLKSDTIFF